MAKFRDDLLYPLLLAGNCIRMKENFHTEENIIPYVCGKTSIRMEILLHTYAAFAPS